MTPVEVETRESDIETQPKAAARAPRGGRQPLPLLLEVGCEEIPARFLRDAEKGLGDRVQAALEDSRLLPVPPVGAVREPPLQTYSTPRRLVVYVPAVLPQQPANVDEILGPPVKVAIDAEGNYTRAAESFAQRNSACVEDLGRAFTPKGEYLSLRKITQGRSAREILPEILPSAIAGLSFPKSMYWTENSAARFVRPIRWVLALVGEGRQATTVEFQVFGVKTGDFTFGHRSKGYKPLHVRSFKAYTKKLLQHLVNIDQKNRRARFVQEAQALVENDSLRIVHDEWLVDWVVNSTEWPHALLGSFDDRFLHLPREILTTVMRDHQKYFAVEEVVAPPLSLPAQAGAEDAGLKPGAATEGGGAKLAPDFVTVLNMDSDAKGLIRQGHKRVLAARFRDAEFFWGADQRVSLDVRRDSLERVTYQAELGSYGDKVRRMRAIASELCKALESQGKFRPVDTDWAMRAIDLCKCDLTTQMVQEFPELQGIVGGLYGQAQGEQTPVYEAIYDHYLPQGADDRCPRSLVGAVVSLADKLDSMVAGFAVGHEPSSSGDPFGLRRLGNGIIKVLLEFKLPIDLSELTQAYHQRIEQAGWFGIQTSVPWSTVLSKVLQFFNDRLLFYLESIRGFRYDNVRAVIAAVPRLDAIPIELAPLDVLQRAEALEALRGSDDLEALCAAAKRIRNILTKSASAAEWTPGEVATDLLAEPQEKELYSAYGGVAEESGRWREQHKYRQALETISTLRPIVDRFFDKVLVMAEDPRTRQNRLRLLKKLDELFTGIAHFAEIAATNS